MPRKARIDEPGALHHIIVRGIERTKIFRSNYDRKNFLHRLSEFIPETRTDCFAWTLTLSHVHLLLRIGSVPISVLMNRLLTGYTGWFNKRHKRHGQLFQNMIGSQKFYTKSMALATRTAKALNSRRYRISRISLCKSWDTPI